MSAINDGGPVFPVMDNPGDGALYCRSAGASLRDYFAAKALPVCISKCVPMECQGSETMAQMFARKAYEAADAMLAARSAQP